MPPAARSPVEKWSGKLSCLRGCRAILVMVAAVAREEPETAPNPAHEAMVAMGTPLRNFLKRRMNPLRRSVLTAE